VGQRAQGPILVVEDNRDTQDAVCKVLAIRGYATIPADDGLDALLYLRSGGAASLIVLDLRLPNMDGWSLRRALGADERFRDIPIIVFSCDPNASGVDDVRGVIRKGRDDPDVLLDLIEHAWAA
jgi:two-component system chemotaxis response regulator CheY